MENSAARSSPVSEPTDSWILPSIKLEFEVASENSDVDETENSPHEKNAFDARVYKEEPGETTLCEPDVETIAGVRRPWNAGHTAKDAGKKPDHCHLCEEGFEAEEDLRLHALSHHNQEPYVIPVKDVAASGGLHFRQVEGETRKTHVCQVCGKGFRNGWKLKTHLRVHTGEKPHECAKCGKKFSSTNNLKVHLRTHTGEKKHTCDCCGKRFGQAVHLKEHMRVHSGEKPYACAECGMKFSSASYKKRHLLTHTGEKPHACVECGKEFSRASRLKRHLLTHAGNKTHS